MPVSPDPKMIKYFYSRYTVQCKLSSVALNSSIDLASTTLKGSVFQPLIIL